MSRKTRSQVRGTLRRPLGVELMEGRLMLSTTALDLPQRELDAPHFVYNQGDIPFTSVDFHQLANPVEGGFVKLSGEPSLFNLNADLASTRLSFSFSDSAQNVGQITFNLGTAGDWFNGPSQYDSEGLQPAKIDPAPDDSDVTTNMSPVVVGPPDRNGSSGEGGSIPIHTILADLQRGSSLVASTRPASLVAAERALGDAGADRRLPLSDEALAGEWARGTVFEIAGGEPGITEASSLRGRDKSNDSLQNAEPLSSVDVDELQQFLSRKRTADRQPSDSPSANESTQAQPVPHIGPGAALALPGSLLPVATGGGLSLALSMLEAAEQASANITTSNETADTTAAATVFEQLGDGNSAILEPAVHAPSWLRSIGASPLLMVLALERIAALNSRRATRDTRTVVSAKLRGPKQYHR